MISASVSLDDKAVLGVIDALPKTVLRAQRSAVSTTTTWARKRLQSRVIAKTGIPSRVFRRFRIKSKRKRETGVVWFGVNPIKAGYVGKVSQDVGGAFAGDYYFEKGFVASMRSGHRSIFKRKGKSRLPIVEQVVDIQAGVDLAEEVAREAQQQLRERFIAKMRELNPHLER